MGKIKINVQAVLGASYKCSSASKILNSSQSTVSSIAGQVDPKVLSRDSIGSKLKSISTNISYIERRVNNILIVAEKGANSYYRTDRKVTSEKNTIKNSVAVKSKGLNHSNAVSAFRVAPTNIEKKKETEKEKRQKVAKGWKIALTGICVIGSVASIALTGGAATPLIVGTVSAISGAVMAGGNSAIDEYVEKGTKGIDWVSAGKEAIIGGAVGFVTGYVGAYVGGGLTSVMQKTSLGGTLLNSSSMSTRVSTGAAIGSTSEIVSGFASRAIGSTAQGIITGNFDGDKIIQDTFNKDAILMDGIIGGAGGAKTEYKQYKCDMRARDFNNVNKPVEQAANRGYEVKTGKNGNMDYSGSDYIAKSSDGRDIIVKVEATGNRKNDDKAAFEIAEKVFGINKSDFNDNYTWQHMADYNVRDNTFTMQFVQTDAHIGIKHSGGPAQYIEYHGYGYQKGSR